MDIRIVDTDVLSDVGSTSNGSSVTNLFGADKLSCHVVYDVTAVPAAAAIATANINTTTDQFFKTSHGLVTGMKVRATTAGTLAVPLVVSTDYFVIAIDADYFQLAASLADALAGTEIDITDVGVTSTTLTPVALACSVTFQKSNDGVNFIDIQTATTVTVDGSVMLEQANVSYKYFKVLKTLTGGNVDMQAHLLVIGDINN